MNDSMEPVAKKRFLEEIKIFNYGCHKHERITYPMQ